MALLVDHNTGVRAYPRTHRHHHDHHEGEKLLSPADELHYASLNDALEEYATAVCECSPKQKQVRLVCQVPTCPSRNCDMHDLKDLQSRCCRIMHALVKRLGSSGVYASYSLTFSPTSQAIVRAVSPTDEHADSDTEEEALERARACDPHTATVLVLDHTPVLVVT